MLDDRGELSRDGLEDLLGDEATDHSIYRRKFSSSLEGQLLDSFFIDIGVDGFGKRDEFCGIPRISWPWEPLMLFPELREGLETRVEGGGSIEFGEVGDEELWGFQGDLEWFLRGHQ